ncbi:SusC/RagA family TonB-linked outer membrane protein [Flavitalea sp.]|nr:SusC/RagA family TonB-linked outer membrane protein [Flavitalea sp.]
MRKSILLFVGLVLFSLQLLAQSRQITGKVTDQSGNAIPNASILVKGTQTGTVTDPEGSYSLNVPPTAKTLVISSVGQTETEINIGNQTKIDVTLKPAGDLSEVVVVGYQTLKKSEVTGAVAKVSGEEIAQKPIGSFTQLIQGKAPGVQVTGQSGRPGQNGYIRVRGTGSINASNEPLIILDGIYINTVSYNMLNPNDIEDISILKDASSQAIYGSRAANGVIVITTKKGKGKPELRYSFQYGESKALDPKNVRLMNSREKLEYEFQGNYTNPILDSMIDNRIATSVFPAGSTLGSLTEAQRLGLWSLAESRGAGDWSKVLLVKGMIQKHEVSLSGSGDKFRYYLSMSKENNDGVVYGSYWNKTGGRMNIEYSALDWLKVGSNLGLTYTTENQVREPFNTQNSYAASFLYNPYEPVYNEDGSFNNTFQGFSSLEGTTNNPQVFDRISSFATLFAEAKFFKHLTLKTQLGINYSTFKEEYYIKPGSNLASILGYNQKRDGGNQDFIYVFTNTAQWQQTFAEKHSLNAIIGTEFNKDKFYSYSLTGRNFPTASVNTLDNSATPVQATTSRTDWSLLSYFGNVAYNYNQRYYLSASVRRDGSSRFGKNQQFANFWGVGASWNVLNESFMKDVRVISSLRIKASVGTAGTVPTGLYDNLGVYSLASNYNGLPAAVPLRLENPDLTWEENKNYDIGLEFGVLNDRLTGTFDYYHRKTNNLIYPKNVSTTTGFTSFTSNVGNLENKGFEISLAGDIIKKKDFTWSLFANYTNNDNKVLKLYSDNVPQTLSRLKEGEPLFTYFMVRWAGVNPQNGKNQFYNIDNTISETYRSSQAVLLEGKSPLVKWYGAFGTNVSYKGIDLAVQFYYSGGNYIMNYQYQTNASEGENINIVQFTNAFDYWKKQGDVVANANLNDLSQRVTFDTDKYLEKGDYITLRDVTLAYNLPADIVSKAKMKGLRVYVQGTNLWLGTKFRGLPEIGLSNSESTFVVPGLYNLYGYPQIRAVTFGVDVRF